MYLASQIDKILESKKDKLVGRATHFYIIGVLNRAFRKEIPVNFRFETYEDYGKEDYSVSGLYDMDTDIRYLTLNFSKACKYFTVKESKWKEFKFSISQVVQHESIHQCQWQYRDSSGMDKEPLDFRDISPKDEDKEYLADVDEIDAYGHDIAMEIKFYYPKEDPYTVLKSCNRRKKLWSYKYYKNAFKGDDWSQIRNRLIKKTYLWLPHVTV